MQDDFVLHVEGGVLGSGQFSSAFYARAIFMQDDFVLHTGGGEGVGTLMQDILTKSEKKQPPITQNRLKIYVDCSPDLRFKDARLKIQGCNTQDSRMQDSRFKDAGLKIQACETQHSRMQD